MRVLDFKNHDVLIVQIVLAFGMILEHLFCNVRLYSLVCFCFAEHRSQDLKQFMATNPTTVFTILDDEREWASYVSCLGLRCDLLCILKLSCIVLAINNLIYELFLMTLMTYTGCLIFFEKKQPSWLNETFSSCSNLESFSS